MYVENWTPILWSLALVTLLKLIFLENEKILKRSELTILNIADQNS